MKLIKGELFNSLDDIVLVTGNSCIKWDGSAVMGRGAALELKNKLTGIDLVFGGMINKICGNLGMYGVVHTALSYPELDKVYGLFQVKYHFKDKALLSLIEYSTYELSKMIDGIFYTKTISMNFPGVGFGHLKYEDVLPIVEKLPDSITLYIRE